MTKRTTVTGKEVAPMNSRHDFYGSMPNPPCRYCGERYTLEAADARCPKREG